MKTYGHFTNVCISFFLIKSMKIVFKNNFVFEDTKGFLDSRSRTDFSAPWPMLCPNA